MLFRESAASLANRTRLEGRLAELLSENFLHRHGHKPHAAEVRSWERSIPVLTHALVEAGLGEVEMLLEYGLPLTSKRADVILAGVHPVSGEPSYVIVELKQWSEAHPVDEDPLRCSVPSYREPVLNPIEQVRGYCDYLVSFNGALEQNPDSVTGVAFLHNATEFGVAGLREVEEDRRGRMFTGDQRGAFLDYLRSRLAAKPGAAAADDDLLQARVRPSRQLMAVAADEVRDREQFVLLDEQRLAYETVMAAVRKARRSNRKQVVVVTGGPGSGKSVIALSVLGDLYRRGVPALHATGSQSFTKTMRKVAGARKPEVQRLFRYFNSFMEAEPNDIDVLVCDEAHRLRKTSANRYTKAALRTGRPQVAELIGAARVPVFLLDQHQVVRPGEMGTVEQIRQAAADQEVDFTLVELDSQFRCGGSDAYLLWVTSLLGLEGEGPIEWEPDGKVQLLTVDSPQELEDFLGAKRAQGYGARLSAGYCWKWTTKITPAMTRLPTDVVIGDWSKPWNLYGDRSLLGAPPAPLWATDPAGFGQVGCVYTAQGFEYDWSGVIMGPDLVWRTDRWVIDRTASKDPSFMKATPDEDIDRLIRNTYKVLLTRGMIGTVVYSTDRETRMKLRSLIP
ncbi:DNA/RNA helicase domain-containing protein [Streptomyces sp. NPDC088137]|uniref:DNA/RNA helicase domain-containing protein n=1 Tax=Streptomyces sp. NPDC088137 TaxID=3365827 RepID=UPI00380A4DB9